jgi:hypothetical protein
MINKSTAPRNVFQAGESWTLTDQPHMHVLQERMPPGQAERRHLHSAVEQLYYILEGVATVRFDDHEETLQPGDSVHVPAAALPPVAQRLATGAGVPGHLVVAAPPGPNRSRSRLTRPVGGPSGAARALTGRPGPAARTARRTGRRPGPARRDPRSP